MFSFTPLIDSNKNKPIYKQLYEYIKNQILTGSIAGGTRLPSLRNLSRDLGVSKNTIEGAYQQLYAEGYIESIPKVGYVVVDIQYKLYDASIVLESTVKNSRFERASSIEKYKYDLSSKNRDTACVNLNAWKKISNAIISKELPELLRYGDPQGELELREEIAKYVYETRGACCHPDQVIIGAGTQFCLGLLCQLLEPVYGNIIAMEDPGSNWIKCVFQNYQFNIKSITFEKNGLNIKELENSNARISFVTPSHQFIKRTIIPIANRIQLLNWAYKNNGIIIEDDYDNEIKYITNTIPSLKSLDKNNNVVYLGSFSKIFMPSIRISYIILPPKLLNVYNEKYKMYEQTTSKLHQKVLARFMKEGYWQKHIRKVKKYYLNKYNAVVRALNTHMKDKFSLISLNPGLAVLLEIKTHLSETELVEFAREAGVNIVPVSEYYRKHIEYKQEEHPTIILSCRGIAEEDIEPAIKLLSKAWFK